MMTDLFGAEHADLLAIIEEGAKARCDKVVASEREILNAEYIKAFEGPFADQLLAAYQRLTPPEEVRQQHYEKFRAFQAFAKNGSTEALPAHGAVIGCYLLHLLTIEHKPPAELKSAADAIVFVHQQKGFHVDGAYIEAALDVANELASGGGDDGGGSVVDGGSPPIIDAPMALAAAGAS
jgi:hypothetical protein